MSGFYLIQVVICICILDGFDGQPLYEDKCKSSRVDEMYGRFNEAYSKVKTDERFIKKIPYTLLN